MIYLYRGKNKTIDKRLNKAKKTSRYKDWMKVPMSWYDEKTSKIYIVSLVGEFNVVSIIIHEFMHKILHEKISKNACNSWDNKFIFSALAEIWSNI